MPMPLSITLTSREQRVIEIRDAAVARAIVHGKWESIRSCRAPGGEVPWFKYEGDGFTIALRIPFGKHHVSPDLSKLQVPPCPQEVARPCLSLLWNLDIWPGARHNIRGKVLNISWDDHGTLVITFFRRGAWENQILKWKTTDSSFETLIEGRYVH